MIRLRIQRINLPSLLKHGCLLGAALAVLPSVGVGLVLLACSKLAQRWIEGGRAITINLLGQQVARIDLVHVLGLEQVAAIVRAISEASPLVVVVSMVWLAIASGAVLAVTSLLVGLAYNGLASLTGGIVVEASASPMRSPPPGRE